MSRCDVYPFPVSREFSEHGNTEHILPDCSWHRICAQVNAEADLNTSEELPSTLKQLVHAWLPFFLLAALLFHYYKPLSRMRRSGDARPKALHKDAWISLTGSAVITQHGTELPLPGTIQATLEITTPRDSVLHT